MTPINYLCITATLVFFVLALITACRNMELRSVNHTLKTNLKDAMWANMNHRITEKRLRASLQTIGQETWSFPCNKKKQLETITQFARNAGCR